MTSITEEDLRKGLKIQRQIDTINELLEEPKLATGYWQLSTIVKIKEKDLKDLVEEIRSRK